MLCPVTVARGSRRRRLRRGRTPVCRVGRRGRPVGGLRGRVSARVRPVGTVVRGTRWRWLGRRVRVWRVGGTRGHGSPMVRPAAATRGSLGSRRRRTPVPMSGVGRRARRAGRAFRRVPMTGRPVDTGARRWRCLGRPCPLPARAVGRRGRPVGGVRGQVSTTDRLMTATIPETRGSGLGRRRRFRVSCVGGTRRRGAATGSPVAMTRGRPGIRPWRGPVPVGGVGRRVRRAGRARGRASTMISPVLAVRCDSAGVPRLPSATPVPPMTPARVLARSSGAPALMTASAPVSARRSTRAARTAPRDGDVPARHW